MAESVILGNNSGDINQKQRRIKSNMTEKLAVLIDADTVPATIAQDLFDDITELGNPIVRRVYGENHYNYSWKNVLAKYALRPVPPAGNVDGRGAICSTMIVEAMDLLYTGRYDGFCIVSNSNDFTGLAQRLREDGVAVHGFGDDRSAAFFRNACDTFTSVGAFPYDNNVGFRRPGSDLRPRDGQNYFPFVKFLDKAIYAQQDDPDTPVLLSKVGAMLLRIDQTFDPRRYGYEHLIEMFKAVPQRYRLSGEGGTLAVQIIKNKPTDSLGGFGESELDYEEDPEESEEPEQQEI